MQIAVNKILEHGPPLKLIFTAEVAVQNSFLLMT